MDNIHFFIIHNDDQKRYQRIKDLLISNKIEEKNVTWLIRPHRNDITPELKNILLKPNCSMPNGYIVCSYKHYIALKYMIENDYKLAIIMEDNIGGFDQKLFDIIPKYLEQLPSDWDILFDGWRSARFIEGPTSTDKLVYLKSNEVTAQCHGSTKSAQFYMLNLQCAKKLYENYLPFDAVPDHHLNFVFRKLNIKSFWTEPCNVYTEENHRSSGFD